MDYLHFNPVKHGYTATVRDWPYSSFHRLAERGVYDPNWGASAAIAELYSE
jgi:putative transposase